MDKHEGKAVGKYVAIFCVCLGVLLICQFYQLPSTNQEWLSDINVPSAEAFDGELFADLIEARLVWLTRSKNRVQLRRIACSSFNVSNPEKVVFRKGSKAEKDKRFVFELCRTSRGKRVLENIDLLNSSNELLAVRDNRYAVEIDEDIINCADSRQVTALFVPDGCLPSLWSASVRDTAQNLKTVSSDSIPIEKYFQLSLRKPAVMSDWAAVRPFFDSFKNQYSLHTFETKVTLDVRPITIQVIGFVNGISINDTRLDEARWREDSSGSSRFQIEDGEVSLAFERLCVDKFKNARTCKYLGPENNSALHVTLNGPVGETIEIALDMYPSSYKFRDSQLATKNSSSNPLLVNWPSVSTEVREIKIECASQSVAYNVEVLDARNGSINDCLIYWGAEPVDAVKPGPKTKRAPDGPSQPSSEFKPKDPQPFSLVLNGIEILNENGELTPVGLKLGYGDILGFGINDLGSYAAFLSAHEGGENIELTVDPDLQSRLVAKLPSWVPSRGQLRETRADIIVMDAQGPDAGRILGFASSPQSLSVNLSAWDVRALSKAKPVAAPFAASLWKSHDNTATPGSTFKIVTALAAIQYVLDEDALDLERILLGETDLPEMVNRLGWIKAQNRNFKGACKPARNAVNAREVDAYPVYDQYGDGDIIHCIGNFGNFSADSYYLSGGTAKNGCRPGVAQRRTGLCEAIQESSNQFFASIAYEITKKALADKPGTKMEIMEEHREDLENIALAKMAHKLSGSVEETGAIMDIYDVLDPNFVISRTASVPIKLRLMDPQPKDTSITKRSRALDAANNGIGQAVDATPVRMAAVAASVASRKIVKPVMIEQAVDPLQPPIPLIDVPVGKEDRYMALIGMLERGMKQAVTNGTATSILRDAKELRDYIYAKTGTAQIVVGGANYTAAWLVGFVRAPGGSSKIKEDIAFACRVAPINSGGGGSICGPIISQMLAELHSGGN